MIRAGIVGMGKMGISHCAIVNAHPKAEIVAVCDNSGLLLDAFKKYSNIMIYYDYETMINDADLDCIFIATPTKYHMEMVAYALSKGIHVFCEKPFVLVVSDGEKLNNLAKNKGVVNQVGYHNRFINTFCRVKKILELGVIGEIYHFHAESHGPVVTKAKGSTWRAKREQGGGCLYDYASHVINLIDFLIGSPIRVHGTMLKRIYSKEVEDAVYSIIQIDNGRTGILSVNWSDESYRKMTIQITIQGKKGKIIANSQEIQIYMKDDYPSEQLKKGWNISYITDYPDEINYYLRGEEYTKQIDYFITKIISKDFNNINSFEKAMVTDNVIQMLIKDAF